MKNLEMKHIAGVISLQSFGQKLNFISGDKMLCKQYSEKKSSERKHLPMQISHQKDSRSKDQSK